MPRRNPSSLIPIPVPLAPSARRADDWTKVTDGLPAVSGDYLVYATLSSCDVQSDETTQAQRAYQEHRRTCQECDNPQVDYASRENK